MGTLYIVSTPIGNLEDITIRAIKTLVSSDAILCEDTRRTGFLLSEIVKRYGEQFDADPEWKPKLIPYYDEIEEKQLPHIIGLLESGKTLALVSDAGTPLVSDPGFRGVRECRKRGIPVVSIPGPSALLTALTSSGLPADKFLFLGYPPEKQSARLSLFASILSSIDTSKYWPTVIFYCAPHKLTQTLEDMKTTFGDIEITLARELTKIHEEIWKGPLTAARVHFAAPQGEFVLLFRLS